MEKENAIYEKFEKNWDKFITRVKGQLITRAKEGVFTLASSNLILAEAVGFWDSRYSEGGRWLDGYEKKCPEKAEIVRDILINDMEFKESSVDIKQPEYLKYLVPVGSAAAGFALSKMAGANLIIQTVCTVAPAVVAYPVTSNVLDVAVDNKKHDVIQDYLLQLDKYKVSVESILLDV